MKKTLSLLVFFVFITGGCALYCWQCFKSPGPSTADHFFVVEQGASVGQIASKLRDVNLIESPQLFKVAAVLSGQATSLKAGEYLVPAGASLQKILSLFCAGRVVLHKITIVEGVTTQQILQQLAENDFLNRDLDAAFEWAEGIFLPETYLFTRGTTTQETLRRMKKAQETFLAHVWEGRAPDLPYHTQEEAVILASIIEKEAASDEEKPLIASVFVNRLRRGMRLQADPTVRYGLSRLTEFQGGLTKNDLRTYTPFNTYIITGLPPTPICNPGKLSILAALNPGKTEYLYFVADGTGGHVFSKTLKEHQYHHGKWRKIRAARLQAQGL